MENRANYLWVGIFVFGVFFLSLFFLVWLGGFANKEEFTYYQIHTKESISGLGVKAPVKLLGVDVGSIEDISIDNTQGIGVKILIKVKKGIPITEDTRAILQLQGITGLKFIELSGSDENSKPLLSKNGDIPTIPTKSSLLSTIDKQSDKIFDLLDLTNERARMLFSDENVKNFAATLENTALSTQELKQNMNSLIQDFNKATKDLSLMAQSVSLASQKFYDTLQNYDDVSVNLSSSLEGLNALLVQLNMIAKNLQNSPSDLLFKSTKTKLAPGE